MSSPPAEKKPKGAEANLRTSSSPATPKSKRDRTRRPVPAAPLRLKDHIRKLKQSPYFYPLAALSLATFVALVAAAIQMASSDNERVFREVVPPTSSPSAATSFKVPPLAQPLAGAQEPRVVAPLAHRAKALERTWALEQERIKREAERKLAAADEGVDTDDVEETGEAGAEKEGGKVEFDQQRYDELREALAASGMDADDLTATLNQVYRGETA